MNNTKHSFTKLTPIQASFNENERKIYQSLLDKRAKNNAKIYISRPRQNSRLKEDFSESRFTYLVK